MINIFLLIPTGVFAEANIAEQDASKTILLTAPGTLSGTVQSNKHADSKMQENMKFSPESTTVEPPQRYNFPHYNFVREHTPRFPQYGQVNGPYNPWAEQESERRLPPALPPASDISSNPWDLSGRYPAGNAGYGTSPGIYPRHPNYYNPPGSTGMPGFGGMDEFQSKYTDGIFRDTNPAMMGPFFNGIMPGLGGEDKLDFPFTPFNMF